MKKEDILDILRSLQIEIEEKYNAEVIGIFGSFVRGEEKETSDIDVLVDFNESADLFDLVGLSLFLEEKQHRKVDVVPIDGIREELKETILKEVVYT
ncbi:MAG TPA: nucleotidyltransferase family protein [bacterium]|nr:nucleotidyltransferase family protein [bacterium]